MIESHSKLLDELRNDIINGDGSEQEIEKSYIFFDAWSEKVILEILSEDVQIC